MFVALWYTLRYKKWLIFFRKNGPRTFAETNWTGWKESPNGLRLYAQAYGRIEGPRFEFYYAAVSTTSDKVEPRRLQEKQRNAQEYLESFLAPECRCRLGLHWKCSVHGKWKN